jgi:glycosyltransferase involved in cell wall biosynthesis
MTFGEATDREARSATLASGAGGRPLRIAHFALGRTNPEAADGMDRTVYHLSRTQAAQDHAVRLFSITNKPPIPIPGVQVSAYPSMTAQGFLTSARLRNVLVWRSPLNLPPALITDLLGWRPDILHLHGVHIPQHLRLARRARHARVPYCVTVHGMLARGAESRRPGTKRVVALFQRPFLDRAAFLHALSEAESQDLRAYGTRAPILVAPNGIDLAEMDRVAPRPASGLGGSLEFMFLGRLDPDQKGLDLLIEAWGLAGLPDATLTLVGPDWRGGRARVEELADRLATGSAVRFTGPAFGAEKYSLLGRSSIFVHTSRWEGLAFAVLEAASLERPLLLTAAADPAGRFGPAGAAVVVPPTPAGIAAGLRRLASMAPGERMAMGRRARALVAAEFSWEAAATALTAGYTRRPGVRT